MPGSSSAELWAAIRNPSGIVAFIQRCSFGVTTATRFCGVMMAYDRPAMHHGTIPHPPPKPSHPSVALSAELRTIADDLTDIAVDIGWFGDEDAKAKLLKHGDTLRRLARIADGDEAHQDHEDG